MGYARYQLPDGRWAGYAVNATCDTEGCKAKIDRGLSYLCGKTPGGDEDGCGNYFCMEHLTADQLCEPCADARPAERVASWCAERDHPRFADGPSCLCTEAMYA